MQTADKELNKSLQSDNQSTTTFEEVLNSTGTLVYKNRGVSMLPLIRQDRDLIVFRKKDPSVRCKRLDAVLFKRPNGQYVLHRILKVTPDAYWIVGDNCTSGEWVREAQVLGILTQVVRQGGRTITEENLSYRLYVRLWCAPWRLRFPLLRLNHFVYRCLRWPWRHILKPLLQQKK